MSGLVISFVGSGWYSFIKLTEKRSSPLEPPVAPGAAPVDHTIEKSVGNSANEVTLPQQATRLGMFVWGFSFFLRQELP